MPIDLTSITRDETVGDELYGLIRELYPIPRSLTGDGVRETLAVIGRDLPLDVVETPSGTEVFDWVVPREWNVRECVDRGAGRAPFREVRGLVTQPARIQRAGRRHPPER